MSNATTQGAGTPASHPRAAGLESVVRDAVREELQRSGGGGNDGGGGELEKRIREIESRLGIIEKIMVSGEDLQRELGSLKAEISKVPFETTKWFFTLTGIIAAIVFGAMKIFG